jgi:hypothetical protein
LGRSGFSDRWRDLNGISVQPVVGKTTLARVSRPANGNDEVAVYKGSVTVASARESAKVSAGHTTIVGPNGSAAQNGQSTTKITGRKKYGPSSSRAA